MSEIVRGFYRATQTGDGKALAALIHPDIEARTAPGMPSGAGGAFHGAQDALTRLWGAIYVDFDCAPYDETWAETADGTVVVTGLYRGKARKTGKSFEAEFVHLWRVADGKLIWLRQFTDTVQWNEALGSAL